MQVRILGGAREVGRSCVLVEAVTANLLLDCGVKKLKDTEEYPLLNRRIAETLDAVFITHAHIDHCAFTPWLYRVGYEGPVYCTHPTAALMEIMLRDCLKVWSERRMLAPYGLRHVEMMESNTKKVRYGETIEIGKLTVTLLNAGHIPGSSVIVVEGEGKKLVYTGDIRLENSRLLTGFHKTLQENQDLLVNPDLLIIEGTYAGEIFLPRHVYEEYFIGKIKEAISRGGRVLIPVFAVERAQTIALTLLDLMPGFKEVYIDGLARKINEVMTKLHEDGWLRRPFPKKVFTYVEDQATRNSIIKAKRPLIVVSPAGMMDGGPIKYCYLPSFLKRKEDLVVIVSFQAKGTTGRKLLDGEINYNCEVVQTRFSAHSDHNAILKIISMLKPKRTLIVHSEAPEYLAISAKKYGEVTIADLRGCYPV